MYLTLCKKIAFLELISEYRNLLRFRLDNPEFLRSFFRKERRYSSQILGLNARD